MDREQQLNMLKLIYENIEDSGYGYALYKDGINFGACNLLTGFDSGILGRNIYKSEDLVIGYNYSSGTDLPGANFTDAVLYFPKIDKVLKLKDHSVVFSFKTAGSNIVLLGENRVKPNIKIMNSTTGEIILSDSIHYRLDNSGACFDGIIGVCKESEPSEDSVTIILKNGTQMNIKDYIEHLERDFKVKIKKLVKNYRVTFENGGTLMLNKWGLPEWVSNYSWCN